MEQRAERCINVAGQTEEEKPEGLSLQQKRELQAACSRYLATILIPRHPSINGERDKSLQDFLDLLSRPGALEILDELQVHRYDDAYY